MSKKNITTASTTTAATMTAAEFKQKSYDAYLAYVEFIEGKKSIIETVEALSPLMSAYGFALTVDNLANLLTVKMTAYGKDKGEQAKKVNLIAIQTYNRAYGRKGRFLICMDALQAWLDGDHERPFYDSDCGNFLVLRLCGGFCKMQLFWLSEYGNGDLHGVRQDVEIPENQFLTLMQNGTPICRLCKPETGNVRFDASPSAQVIRGILSDKRKRRAFSKAMRNNFRWKDSSRITLYPDGADSFYFDASGSWPLCGGLILHDGIVRTPQGNLPKFYYGIHT